LALAWEGSHVGWNTSLTFDDSDAAGWHTPVPRDVSQYGSIAINHIWADDPQLSGDTPAYFRKVFALDFEPVSASFGGDTTGMECPARSRSQMSPGISSPGRVSSL
jgi:hypothetical protein